MNYHKKSFIPGWEYIVGFLILSLAFVFIVGINDFYLVEFFNPVSDQLINETIKLTNDSNNDIVLSMQKNAQTANSLTLPYNLLFMFVFFASVMISMISVAKTTKADPINLLYQTMGGIIFLIFLVKVSIIKLLEYAKLEFVDVIFDDLVNNYVPFYATILDNWGVTILIWGLSLVLSNWLFGKSEAKF